MISAFYSLLPPIIDDNIAWLRFGRETLLWLSRLFHGHETASFLEANFKPLLYRLEMPFSKTTQMYYHH